MKKRFIWLYLLILLISCGDLEEGSFIGPSLFDVTSLVGTWNAFKAEFTNKDSLAQTIDQFASANIDSIVLTFSVPDTLKYRTVSAVDSIGSVSFISNFRVDGDNIFWFQDTLEIKYEFSLQRTFIDTVLKLVNNNAFFDFNNDSIPEPAIERLELRKISN